MSKLLESTEPSRRNYRVALLVGLIAGAFSAIVKFGWEVPFPPRTPERNAVNPPQTILEQIGFPETISRATIHFNGWDLPISSFIIHFGFAIFFGVLYCVVAERFPGIKLWQGAAFGIFLHVFFHEFLMPLMQTVPAPWDQPWQEHFSELFGHIIWMWSIEIVRRDLRNRFTHQPDPEVPLKTPEAVLAR
ncbi:YagU family protein [Tessaracoccus caeni]|uniref:YagU family protein n=1 Tax=Tessaracoccus caeni TaxID=3031239 RepID=UPI0023DB7AFE|nr:YagU family protein [Tessaracoccus caeni]MDF1489701.1 YagU family protein [Tessaracoccus caeni]